MSPKDPSLSSLYQSNPSLQPGTDANRFRDLEEITSKSIDQITWASSQSLAINKLKLFSTMAKMVNDQQ